MNKIILFFLLAISITSYAQKNNTPHTKSQFIYILKLTPQYHEEKNWTPEAQNIVKEHFLRLQQMYKDGLLYIAGRTDNELSKTIGIVVYDAENFEKAKEIAESDPAVKAGIMSVEIFPYTIALLKGRE
jgi:uncharacterized protein